MPNIFTFTKKSNTALLLTGFRNETAFLTKSLICKCSVATQQAILCKVKENEHETVGGLNVNVINHKDCFFSPYKFLRCVGIGCINQVDRKCNRSYVHVFYEYPQVLNMWCMCEKIMQPCPMTLFNNDPQGKHTFAHVVHKR